MALLLRVAEGNGEDGIVDFTACDVGGTNDRLEAEGHEHEELIEDVAGKFHAPGGKLGWLEVEDGDVGLVAGGERSDEILEMKHLCPTPLSLIHI